jgi:hypothetical protein
MMKIEIGPIKITKGDVTIELTVEEAKELSKNLTDIFWPKMDLLSGTSTTKLFNGRGIETENYRLKVR